MGLKPDYDVTNDYEVPLIYMINALVKAIEDRKLK